MSKKDRGLELFAQACAHHQRNELSDAERLYKQAIELDPELIDALRNLGAMLRQLGRAKEGLFYQRQALSLRPNDAGLLGNTGNALRDLGRFDEAKIMFQKATIAQPNSVGARLGLAITLNALGEYSELIKEVENYLENNQNWENSNELSQLYLELGNAYHRQGNTEAAIELWEKARQYSNGSNTLAMALNTAQALCEKQKYNEAEEVIKPCLKKDDSQPNLNYALGVILKGQGRWEEACQKFEYALKKEPRYAICLNTYGLLLREMGHIHRARECFEKALEIDSNFGAAMNNLGSVLKDVARYDEAVKWLRKGAKSLGFNAAAHSNVLFTLCGYELETEEDRFKEAERFGKKFSNSQFQRWKDQVIWPKIDKTLQIGLVSPDFCRHAVSYFIEPLIEQWKFMDVEITLYAAGHVRDDYTERLKQKADRWRDIQTSSDELIVQQIQQDEIDILIDLAGHTAGNRLSVFTYKSAPIQATYLGYYGTTGLNQIDYWITDNILHPREEESAQKSTEKKWRLERAYVSYRPLKDAPEVAELPMIDRGVPMVGSFNQSRKITYKTALNWMSVMNRIKDCHLYLKSKNLGEPAEAARVREMFENLGLERDRLHLEGHSMNVATHLDRYRNLDIALDTFPYTGCTTTADALWMGVPVLTVVGRTMVSRQAAAVLSGINRTEWICANEIELADKAEILLSDKNKLRETRKNLRSEMLKSDLLDHRGLAESMYNSFRDWWQEFLVNEKMLTRKETQGDGWPTIKGVQPDATFSPIPR